MTKYVLLNPSTFSWRRSLSYHNESIRLKKRKLAKCEKQNVSVSCNFWKGKVRKYDVNIVFFVSKDMFTLLVILFVIKLYAQTDISKVRNLSNFYSRLKKFFLWGLRYTSTGFLWVLSIWRDTAWVTNIHKRFILSTTNLQVCSFVDDNNWYNCNKNPQHIKIVSLHGSFQPIWYSAFPK